MVKNSLNMYQSIYVCFYRILHFLFNEGISDTTYNVASITFAFLNSIGLVQAYQLANNLNLIDFDSKYASGVWLLSAIAFNFFNYYAFVLNDKYLKIFKIAKKSHSWLPFLCYLAVMIILTYYNHKF